MSDRPIIKEDAFGKGVKKTNAVIMKKLGWMGVLIISFVYLFWGFFKPLLNDQTIWETLLSSGVSMLIALSISNLLRAQGIMSGSVDEDVMDMKKKHVESVVNANEYVEYSDSWSDEENKIALRSARKHILMSAGLKYHDFFNDDGDYLDTTIPAPEKDAPKYIKKRYKNKLGAIRKSLTYQITPISMARLSAETTVNLDPNRLDAEPSEYQKAKAIKSVWTKILSVVVFGKITWTLIEGADFWQSLFNGAIQLVVFLLLGIISFYGSYIYMTNVYVGNLRKKINLLSRLVVFGKRQRIKEAEEKVKKEQEEKQKQLEEAQKAKQENNSVKEAVKENGGANYISGKPKYEMS